MNNRWKYILFFVLAIFLIAICVIGGMFDMRSSQKQKEIEVLWKVTAVAKKIEGDILSTFNLTSGIANIIRYNKGIDREQFEVLCNNSLIENNNIRIIALAPNNVVSMIFPQTDSEIVIGHDLTKNKEQWPSIERSIKYRKDIIDGPVTLIQGGIAIINRSPVFVNENSDTSKYWGIVSTIAYIDSILNRVGLYDSTSTLNFALTSEKSLIFGDSSIIENNPVEVDVNIKNVHWKLLAVPKNGWKSNSTFKSSFFWICILFSIVVFILILQLIGANNKLNQNNTALTREINVRKKIEEDLIQAKNLSENQNNLKSLFLADMSHEIRSPMNSIQGFTDLIMNRGLNMDSTLEYVEIINSSSKRLLAIINDAIDVSMIDSKKLKLFEEPFSINKVINNVVKLNQIFASKNSDTIKAVLPFSNGADIAFIDSNRLTQVINNLVTNAIKFTKNGEITVTYSIESELIKFCVSDTGVGIPDNLRNNIFDRYEQVDGKISTKIGGSGLGLSICKSIVEMMKGRIWYESAVNKGSKFYFTIPYIKCSNSSLTMKENAIMNIDLTGKTLLITDDEASNRTLFTAMFRSTNVNLLLAKNGPQAIEIVSNQHVDIILMDIKMLGMDGYDTTRQIRKINKDVPIIAQTAYIMPENRQRSFDAGCNYYITKPIDIQELFALISEVLSLDSSTK